MKIIHVVGARPNFMKIAPIIDVLSDHNRQHAPGRSVHQLLVHTGQHYDESMSGLFFEELSLPRPDINLEIGSGPHGQQTGRIMEAFEQVLLREKPDLVIVVGDVNSTMACAIAAKKLNIPVGHVEAGLRSRDMTMPEEINRIVTDAIADLLFTTDRGANENLKQEGIAEDKIHFVGNVMIDTLLKHREKALTLPTLDALRLKRESHVIDYTLVTLHRPSNVDTREALSEIGRALQTLAQRMPIIFPAHPRTQAAMKEFGMRRIFPEDGDLRILEPYGYLDFLNLQANARVIITDSGGIQEEATILGIPCLTLRPNTERPITLTEGTNRLVASKEEAILASFEEVVNTEQRATRIPELWDGNAATRIVGTVLRWFSDRSP
jgi:UDP-N-acetylglucosamine 2-epimerase (non-hydrolysing)